MATRKDYVSEKMRKADELAASTAGVARSESEYNAQKKAWKEAFDAQARSEKVGAGRGLVNPPAINSREQYMHEKEAGDPSANRLSFEEWKKL
jgi:hypothetical protein